MVAPSPYIVEDQAQNAARHYRRAQPLHGPLPHPHGPRYSWILRQAIPIGPRGVLEHINDVGPADSRGIVNAGIGMTVELQRGRARFRLAQYLGPWTEGQAVGRTGF